MKRLISVLLTVAMLFSVLPMIGFAEEENAPNESAAETTVSKEEMPGLGTEASVGDTMFYIEDGSLLRSQNHARSQTVDTDVSWVIAREGKIYWSKLEEHNTSTVYFCSASEASGEALQKVFVPVEAFDISGEELYYLYNGEIVKVNTQTGKEYSMGMFDCDAFYLDDDTILPIKNNNLQEKELANIQLNALSYNDYIKKIQQINSKSPVLQAQMANSSGSGLCNVATMTMLLNRKAVATGNANNTYSVYDVFKYTGCTNVKNTGTNSKGYGVYSYNGGTGSSHRKTYTDANNKLTCKIEPLYTYENGGSLSENVIADILKEHPEGIAIRVLYNSNNGHWFVITDFEQNSNGTYQFYAIDPVRVVSGKGRIKIEDTWPYNNTKQIFSHINHIAVISQCSAQDTSAKHFTWSANNTSSGDTKKNTTTNTKKQNSVVSPAVTVNLTSKPTEIFAGQSYPVRGKITSNYPIYFVGGTIIDSNGNNVIPWIDLSYSGTKSISIGARHLLNTKMTFDSIKSPGKYRIRILVNCNKDGSQTNVQTRDFEFNVKTEQQCQQPQFSVSSIEEGQRVRITSPDGGYVRYNLNGGYGGEGSSITRDLTTPGTYNFYAWETKSGYNDSPAITRSISVQKVGTPSISDVKYGANSAWVTISGDGDIHYTMNGSNPSKNSSSYNGTIYLYDSTTIKAMASRYGQVNSDVASKYLSVAAPDTPTGLKLYNTKQKIAQGKTATVRWNAMDRATGYEARLYYNGEQVGRTYETNGTTAAFKLSDVGTYTIKVKAKNFKGSSAECDGITVESMAPVTITFVDKILRDNKVTDDVVNQIQQNINAKYEKDGKENPPQIEGNVISVQKIDYDTKPHIPLWEDKPGLSRQMWSDEATEYALKDTTVYAYYSVRSYNVSFWNFWTDDSPNNCRLSTQNILYSFSAEAPTEFNMPPGYILAGWNVDTDVSNGYDFTFVDGDIKLSTVYAWENKDLPVVLEVLGAKRGNTCQSYDITLRYINNNLTDTQARIIVSLYTSDGRMVYTTTEDIDLMKRDPGKYYTENIQADYTEKISRITAVMVQVKNDKTGGAVSKMVETTNIETPNDGTYWEKWSDWSTTQPSNQPAYKNDVKGNAREIKQKTQYRYRNREWTTRNNTKWLSGWNYDRSDSHYYGEVDNGTNWVGEENSDYRRRTVKTSTVQAVYKTQYHYYRYYKGYSAPWVSYSSSHPYYEDRWTDSELPWLRYSGGCHQYGDGYTGNSGNKHWLRDVNNWTRSVQVSGGYTKYFYTDTYYTHYFWRWYNWSDWSDSYNSGDQTETRTVYSYRDNHSYYPGYDPSRDSLLEEATKKKYELSGNIVGLSDDYNGKLGTVLVYKKTNTDPTQKQLEYVDQVTLGENNSYSFTVNPKEELSENTGDFIVTLSIEGCDRLANIDVIKAPAPQCTVTFQNDDGSVLKDADGNDVEITVDKGGSIDAYDVPIPHKDGHRFVKWDTSLIDIKFDMTVSPIYERETYNVVFVDYENQTADMVEVKYGDPIVLPEVEPIEGKEFIGWDAECYKYATEGNIDTDIFNIKEETPYYLLTDGSYILTTEYDSTKHNIVDETEYYKYFSEKNTTITESKIVSAKWKSLEYTVKFCDFDGNVVTGDLGEQKVKYGESAQPPASLEKDGVMCPWDLTGGEWWNVKQDMTITPYVPQTVQVDAPTISAPTTDAYGEYKAELETSAENSKIYYTLDCGITESDIRKFVEMQREVENDDSGESETAETSSVSLMSADTETATEEPIEVDGSDEYNENAIDYIEEYTEPISLYAGNVVYAFTVDKDGNISTISVFQYDYNADDDMLGDASNEYVPDSDVPQITMATINAKPGETVTVPVKIKNNMGITNLSMILGYDADDLTLDSVENGDVFADSEFASDIRDDGSCKFTWKTESDNSNDGTLMNLTFTVKDTADKSKYMLDLRVDYSGDENDEEWYFVTVPGALTGEEKIDGTLGDVNGDGDIDFADAILTLKYDAGLKELEENQLLLGDVNGDGDVDFSDAILIIKYDAGLISEFKK